ncbi:MAG: MFS transporter [Actinomycetota bacterium]|nr:MAG: MFS transporter [Actinomycetota bacterium]
MADSAPINHEVRNRPSLRASAQAGLAHAAKSGWHSLRLLFGGPARTRVILLLAGVLALNSADIATVGASATQLRQGLHISNTDIGLLVAGTAIVAAVFSIPFGILVDRAHRVALISITVTLWGVVMFLSAFSTSFGQLMIARLVLGAITAVSGPGVASLIGDYFPAGERGKIYGYVLAGELLGAGIGFIISGDLADISWRAAFAILALPTIPLAWALVHLPEPARGGASHMQPGALRIVGRREIKMHQRMAGDQMDFDIGSTKKNPFSGRPGIHEQPNDPNLANEQHQQQPNASDGAGPGAGTRPTDAQELADRLGIQADPDSVLRTDPRHMNVFAMIRYVLKIRTNVFLIISGICSYFFLTGVETFGLEFVKGQYHVEQLLGNLLMLIIGGGALLGVLVGGRLGDNLIKRGRLGGRLLVAAVAAILTTVLFVPAFVTHSAMTALPYIIVAGFAVTAQNPPIDAARLDIMPPLLWGRAEGVRSLFRTAAQALAPLAFGTLSDAIGLRSTFAVMLVPFLASGIVLLWALRTYPTDVATAAASTEYEFGK